MAAQSAVVTGVFPDLNGVSNKNTWTNATGFGTPEATMLFRSQAHSGANPEVGAALSIGFYDGTDDMAAAFFSENNLSAATDTQRASDPAKSHIGWDNARTAKIVGETDFQTDGIGVWNTANGGQAPGDVYGQAVVFNNIAGVKVQEVSLGTGSTAITVTSTGVRPDLVFITHCMHPTNAQAANAQIGFGMIHNHSVDGIRQVCTTINSTDNSTESNVDQFVTESYCAWGFGTIGTLGWRCAAENFTSNSFDIKPGWSCGGDVVQVISIELNNQDDAWVGTIGPSSLVADKTYSVDTGLTPDTVVIAGGATVTSLDTITAGGGFFVGVSDATNERCLTIADEEAATTSNTESEMTDDHISLCNTDTGVQEAKANLKSTASGEFVLTYSDATSSALKWIACAIGGAYSLGAPILANTRAQMAPILMR